MSDDFDLEEILADLDDRLAEWAAAEARVDDEAECCVPAPASGTRSRWVARLLATPAGQRVGRALARARGLLRTPRRRAIDAAIDAVRQSGYDGALCALATLPGFERAAPGRAAPKDSAGSSHPAQNRPLRAADRGEGLAHALRLLIEAGNPGALHAFYAQAAKDPSLAEWSPTARAFCASSAHREACAKAVRVAVSKGNARFLVAVAPFMDLDFLTYNGWGAATRATPLMLAAEADQNPCHKADYGLACLFALLPFSDARQVDGAGETALMKAARSGNPARIALLLPHSDARAQSAAGKTALVLAAEASNRVDVLQALLPAIDARVADHHGATALMRAAGRSWPAAVELLLAYSDANARDEEGKTALWHAASYAFDDLEQARRCVELLLPHADARIADSAGETPLMKAAGRGDARLVERLLPASDAHARDKNGWTAFMWAAARGRHEAVTALWDASDLAATDLSGRAAVLIAADRKVFWIADRLAEYSPPDQADRALQSAIAQRGSMPRWLIARAEREAQALRDAIAEALPRGEGGDGGPSATASAEGAHATPAASPQPAARSRSARRI